jgi:hypothetical protein
MPETDLEGDAELITLFESGPRASSTIARRRIRMSLPSQYVIQPLTNLLEIYTGDLILTTVSGRCSNTSA